MLVTSACLGAVYARLGVPFSDEGAMLTNAARMLRGAVFYRDLDAYPFPLATWFLALAMKLFGEHFTVARVLAVALNCTMVLALYATALRVLEPRRAALFGVLLLALKPLAWPAFTFYLYSEFAFAFTCVSVALVTAGAGRPGRLLLAGLCAAAVVLAKQNLGFGLVAVSCVLLFLPGLRVDEAGRRERLRDLTSFGVGVALPVLTFLTVLTWQGVLIAGIESGLLRPFTGYLPSSGVPFTPMLAWWNLGSIGLEGGAASYLPLHPLRAVKDFHSDPTAVSRAAALLLEAGARFVYTSIPLAFLASFLCWMRPARDVADRGARRNLFALALVAAVVALSAWPRADIYHVLHVYPLTALVLFALGQRVAGRERPPWLVAALVAVITIGSVSTARWFLARTTIPVRLERADLFVELRDAFLEPVVRGIRAEVAPGAPIFVYGSEAYYYFLADRYGTWVFPQLYPGQTGTGGGEEVIERLRRDPPHLVVRGRLRVGGLPDIREYAPVLNRYLKERYVKDQNFLAHRAVPKRAKRGQPTILRPRGGRLPAPER
ncbi:MAG: glycosyltransferase family 39 protein [Myxococcota bacterium]|nr:glycosyltransferase family 39 protein [Myxococcota bacterium]MDP7074019.1 glycosyltransferase family 39 protein [Myxococcota bacterium]MDP7431482.1 glycosyltransferase family 39 protein [Myxococcota bacterium]